VAEQKLEKARQREQRRQERLERFEAKQARFEAKLAHDPNASEPSSVSNSTFTIDDEDTGWLSSQAEMVLEPYFMSLDNTWSRLQAIGEFIDDTEDYVNITLDSHRNQLIQVDLLLTAGTFCGSLVTVVAGIFGMNLWTGWDVEVPSPMFMIVSVTSSVLATLMLVAFVLFMRYKRLAFI
jgi:magnesium transporter